MPNIFFTLYGDQMSCDQMPGDGNPLHSFSPFFTKIAADQPNINLQNSRIGNINVYGRRGGPVNFPKFIDT